MNSDLRVVGLDLSLSSTGIARYDPDESPEPVTCAVHSHLRGVRRLHDLQEQILGAVGPVHLAAIEGYSFASRNSQAHSLGELGGIIRLALYEHGIPFVVISPSEVKKYATGNGGAGKLAVHDAAIHRTGRAFATMDESDAFWLLQMALAHLGLPHIEMPKPNRAVLDRIAWPAIPALEAR